MSSIEGPARPRRGLIRLVPAAVAAALATTVASSAVAPVGATTARPIRPAPSVAVGPPGSMGSVGAFAGGPVASLGAGAGAAPEYRPPVDAPVIDPFRLPTGPFGAGNRGLTYALAPLTPVRAAAAGEVVFAGAVAGTLHVTVRHADGLRTSYSFLASIEVVAGSMIAAGTVVGRSAEVLHVGARTPDGTYLDPALLWGTRWEPRLVPGGDDGATAPPEPDLLWQVVQERAAPLASWLATGGRSLAAAGTETVDAFGRRLRLWMHYADELAPETHLVRFATALDEWGRQHGRCTAVDAAVAPPGERRIVIEVGGIGSTSDHAAVARLDTAALGYDPADVVRFSYAGGRVPPPADRAVGGDDPFASLATTRYDALDSQIDIEESGRRLAVLLDDVARAAPGVPIDVVAHSQGGVVSRLALERADRDGRLPREVQTLVTLSSPHQGADLATAIEAVRGDPTAASLLDEARLRLGVELDPALPAASQLSEVSPVIGRLGAQPVPGHVRFTSIAARGDLVVPAGRTAAPGAQRTTVTLMGVSAHDELPESPAATREVLLAVTGRPPTCRSLTDAALDAGVSDAIGLVEDSAGATGLGLGVAIPG